MKIKILGKDPDTLDYVLFDVVVDEDNIDCVLEQLDGEYIEENWENDVINNKTIYKEVKDFFAFILRKIT